jgi:hypothetical protein
LVMELQVKMEIQHFHQEIAIYLYILRVEHHKTRPQSNHKFQITIDNLQTPTQSVLDFYFDPSLNGQADQAFASAATRYICTYVRMHVAEPG